VIRPGKLLAETKIVSPTTKNPARRSGRKAHPGEGSISKRPFRLEDRARYREVFTKARDARVDHVDFDLSVGVKIPSSTDCAHSRGDR
jgi:hypothetical protein